MNKFCYVADAFFHEKIVPEMLKERCQTRITDVMIRSSIQVTDRKQYLGSHWR
jgi:hypothetical protein